MFQNADTNGARPLKYSFDVATDAAFKNIVFARTGVEPNAAGVTQFQLPDKLAAGTYWWRTRAGGWREHGSRIRPTKSFKVLAEVVLAPPMPSIADRTAHGLRSDARLQGEGRRSQRRHGRRSNTSLQVSNNSSFTSIAATFIQAETWPETRIDRGYSFLHGRTYYWRVRAWHTADGIGHAATGRRRRRSGRRRRLLHRRRRRPAIPAVTMRWRWWRRRGGSNPGTCNSSKGTDIAECIEARYPQYLAAGVSLDDAQSEHAVPARSHDRARQVQGPATLD